MNTNQNPKGSITIDSLTKGAALLYRIRKVHKVEGDPTKGFKPSIELVEYVDNDKRPVSAIAEMNSDDDRFIQEKPQHAFQPVSIDVAIGNGWITQEVFDNLQPSKGVEGAEQLEGTHFIAVNKLSPVFNGKRLRVRVLETTETNRKGVRVKINPKTGATVLHKGKPVYRDVSVQYEGNHESHFLASDNTTALLTGEKQPVIEMEIPENTPSVNLNA